MSGVGRITALILGALATPVAGQRLDEIALRPGLVITRSVRIAPRVYRLRAPAPLDSPLVTIRGDDVVVDFAGATLLGVPDGAAPDEAAGVAVLIDGGRNVALQRARIHGYKVAVLARGTRNLRLEGNDLSRNWKPRLYSLVEHESLVDWLSFHHNEHGEWLRFGAGVYLDGVRGGEIKGNVMEQGMNGLLLTRTDSLLVWNNDLSFNSGLGVGLYRSSDNRIMHNRVDYDVRGYSEGFYRRGQDSAGILIYEQSCRNVIAFNSVTHGGDGLFLWAGQSTMDTGTGGANDNIVVVNDFSFAPANGIEATFSRNLFVRNRVVGNEYGLWGGYSFDSFVLENVFEANRTGVAIEHGQNNRVVGNEFRGDSTAIRLWADSIESSDWGYPKHRDTRSRDALVARNLFRDNRVGLRIARTSSTTMDRNRFEGVDTNVVDADTSFRSDIHYAADSDARDSTRARHASADIEQRIPKPLRGALSTGRAIATLPRRAIIVDEWGPYDWKSPKLWPADSSRALPLRLLVLGPPGRWRVASARGLASMSRRRGLIERLGVPDTISVRPHPDSSGDWRLTLEHRGHRGAPTLFSYERFEPRLEWRARVYQWSDSSDPRAKPAAFAALLAGSPVLERRMPRLDLLSYRPAWQGVPAGQWALEAVSSLELPAGAYTLRTISDDAIRVWIDDTLAIDHWTPHESAVDWAPLGGGRHVLRVQYVQVSGWAELRVEILRGAPVRSAGSPGPH